MVEDAGISLHRASRRGNLAFGTNIGPGLVGGLVVRREVMSMGQKIRSYTEDPDAVDKVDEGFALPFRWDPTSTSLVDALEESRQYWQDPQHGAMPPEFVEALNRSLTELVAAGLNENSIQVGDKFPMFFLPNQIGDMVRSDSLLSKGPLVVTFYRGGWSPYCNFALRALQHALPELEELGAHLVAITPEHPDDSLSTVGKNGLGFDVLTDDGLRFAEELGIVWKVPEYALQWHEQHFGIYFEEHNGKGNRDEMPVPATYVINQDGIVTWRFVEAEYWKRAEPKDVLEAVRLVANESLETALTA